MKFNGKDRTSNKRRAGPVSNRGSGEHEDDACGGPQVEEAPGAGGRFGLSLELLEDRTVLSPAFDLIGLTAARQEFPGIDGTGVGIAIIDTGVDSTHNLLRGGYLAGRDFVARTDTQRPVDDHGTHVAGIAAARNPEIGVATDASLFGLQVFTVTASGVGAYDNHIEQALQWALNWNRSNPTRPILVVNMSLGSGFYRHAGSVQSILADDVRALEAAGVTVVSAAGNSYKETAPNRNAGAPGVFSTLVVGSVWQDGVTPNARWLGGAVDNTTGPDRLVSHSQRPAEAPVGPYRLVATTLADNPEARQSADYNGDGRPDLTVYRPWDGVFVTRSGLDGASREITGFPQRPAAVPVASPLFFRLRATGNLS